VPRRMIHEFEKKSTYRDRLPRESISFAFNLCIALFLKTVSFEAFQWAEIEPCIANAETTLAPDTLEPCLRQCRS